MWFEKKNIFPTDIQLEEDSINASADSFQDKTNEADFYVENFPIFSQSQVKRKLNNSYKSRLVMVLIIEWENKMMKERN